MADPIQIHCENSGFKAPRDGCECYPCRTVRRGVRNISDAEDIGDLAYDQACERFDQENRMEVCPA